MTTDYMPDGMQHGTISALLISPIGMYKEFVHIDRSFFLHLIKEGWRLIS